ncbi:Murein peptide amidase A [Pantoea sp. Nvir]|uniref:murein tripeptide amidase MpaA n=1 Tax=Pantoea TaxID=53335 RepID=UPI000CDCEFAB|nr:MULTISPECIES: murein tripeptide amidase MpaA [Pantoea]MCG7366300.1 murein tripeptide amidase MpaA [Pantoea sp. ACRSH]MCG7396836.1 murein tripeptide amidase MpaA [Pantoea sp. ACRSC]POW57199.1 murein peptide amidase A [Pantoea alvi]UBN56149.1 murein tripeptide amidase MpaA [Pantoea agglomerans]
MTVLHPRPRRGKLEIPYQRYGDSVLGAPLLWFPAPAADSDSGLILAGTHGDENAAIATLSAAMRTLPDRLRRHHVVLAVNPDGCQLGLRANAHGVDLNRNFPAANWQSGDTVYRWNSVAETRDVLLSTGDRPGSEPETQALCELIHGLKPRWVVSWHEPLACIDDPRDSELGRWLAQQTALPVVSSVGYDTPGSFGSWCNDLGLPCITAEMPAISVDEATERYLEAMINLLRWQR